MTRFLVLACGLAALAIGSWRGYLATRAAVAPLVHDGDPTRTAIEATRRVIDRPRFRLFARRLVVAIGWLAVAMYGLFLVTAAQVAG
jgi:hypothetical protein